MKLSYKHAEYFGCCIYSSRTNTTRNCPRTLAPQEARPPTRADVLHWTILLDSSLLHHHRHLGLIWKRTYLQPILKQRTPITHLIQLLGRIHLLDLLPRIPFPLPIMLAIEIL